VLSEVPCAVRHRCWGGDEGRELGLVACTCGDAVEPTDSLQAVGGGECWAALLLLGSQVGLSAVRFPHSINNKPQGRQHCVTSNETNWLLAVKSDVNKI
jgi:hypothetical protein